jgi:selenocysteine lyase/cysteine desulfurase
LAETFAYKVRPAGDDLPHRFETGTLSHEGMAGTLGAVEYLAALGRGNGASYPQMSERGAFINRAFDRFAEWERQLCLRLIEGLSTFRKLTVRGITSSNAMHRRVPTVSFTVDGIHPQELAKALARENIFVWSGHNYAIEPVKRMGLMESGGVLRVGLTHYNTPSEIDAFLGSMARIARDAGL